MSGAQLAEEIRLAERARAWEIASRGHLIPSDEDRRKHERLLGPMTPAQARLARRPGA